MLGQFDEVKSGLILLEREEISPDKYFRLT